MLRKIWPRICLVPSEKGKGNTASIESRKEGLQQLNLDDDCDD